jgi:hypothetical protein
MTVKVQQFLPEVQVIRQPLPEPRLKADERLFLGLDLKLRLGPTQGQMCEGIPPNATPPDVSLVGVWLEASRSFVDNGGHK